MHAIEPDHYFSNHLKICCENTSTYGGWLTYFFSRSVVGLRSAAIWYSYFLLFLKSKSISTLPPILIALIYRSYTVYWSHLVTPLMHTFSVIKHMCFYVSYLQATGTVLSININIFELYVSKISASEANYFTFICQRFVNQLCTIVNLK